MPLLFSGQPFVKDKPIAVWLHGRDSDTGANVDCRVGAKFLNTRGAEGIANQKLLDAFEQNRQEIEATAQRKYEIGHFEQEPDRLVVYVP